MRTRNHEFPINSVVKLHLYLTRSSTAQPVLGAIKMIMVFVFMFLVK